MAEEPDPVQPEDGQGGEGGDAPYAEYLNRIPEEVRSEVEPVFRDWDSNTTRRFQEAAEYKRGWEPFEELGVNQRDPQEVQWAMQFVDALQNPSAIKEWFDGYAKENGLTPAQEAQLEQEYVDPSVQALVEQQLQAQLGPVASQLAEMSQWRQNQEQQAREAQAMSQIKTEIDDLKAKHPDEFNEQMVEKLLPQYIESDPQHAVQRAFSDWQAIRSQIEKDTMQGKANAPAAAVSGGSADGAPEPISTLKQAAEAAMEQLRAGRG